MEPWMSILWIGRDKDCRDENPKKASHLIGLPGEGVVTQVAKKMCCKSPPRENQKCEGSGEILGHRPSGRH